MNHRFRLTPARASSAWIAAVAMTAVLLSGVALAQPPQNGPRGHDGARHGPPGAEQQLARLDQTLDLSDDQSAELLELLQAAETERRALHERILTEYRPDFCALQQETEAGILALLTPEQARSFETLKADRRDRLAGRWGHGVPGLDCENAGD